MNFFTFTKLCRTLLLATAAVLTAVCLAGCGGDSNPGGGGGGSGVFTVTDIPAEYNGKYADFQSSSNGTGFIVNRVIDDTGIRLEQINNGQVNLHLFLSNHTTMAQEKYTGNYTGSASVGIFNDPYLTSRDYVVKIMFGSVTISNGSGTVSASTGRFVEKNN
jgi:hypothetical protein